MFILIPVAFFLLINLLTFTPFFHLGLFGDDWLAIFRYFYYIHAPQHLGPYSTHYFNQFTYFLNSYGSQDTIMALLYKNFGEQSNIYFIISYLLRVIAGFSIYLPAFYLTKNKLASWFGVFFFLFSAIGLEASGWVFNMPSYLAITFFNLFLYFFLKEHVERKMKYLFLSFLLFYLTFISTPIRAHGLLPFIFFVEVFWLIFKKNGRLAKRSLIRIGGFIFIFMMIYFSGFNLSPVVNLSSSIFNPRFNNILKLLSQNRFDFLFYPIATLGSMIIPDSFVPHGWEITSFSQYLSKIFFPIFFVYIIVVIILKRAITNLNHKFISITSLIAIVWAISVLLIYKNNLPTFSNANYVSLLLIGGYFLSIVLTIFVCLKSNTLIKASILIALGWTVLSFLFTWWIFPDAIFLTTHRYLIVSGTGISLLFAGIISLGKNTKYILTLFILSSIFLILHTFTTRSYLNEQYKTHSHETVNKIWSAMPFLPEVGKSKEPLVFYFEGDNTNGAILRDSVTYGFPPHMALLYGVSEYELAPAPMDDWKEVESAVRDGKSLAKYYGVVQKPISIQRIYGFHLQGENLINITDQIRNKLTKQR